VVSRAPNDSVSSQISIEDNIEDMTTDAQVNITIEKFNLSDAKNSTGIAFALVQLPYYHYPMEEVCIPDIKC
jgi:hypothetical protein